MNEKIQNTAEKIRRKGRYGDTLLAHINPYEAEQLANQRGGYSVNPNTGLLEFYNLRDFLGDVAGVGGTILGGMTGPLGGAVGSSVGFGLRDLIKGNKFKTSNLLKNAAIGSAVGYAIPKFSDFINSNNTKNVTSISSSKTKPSSSGVQSLYKHLPAVAAGDSGEDETEENEGGNKKKKKENKTFWEKLQTNTSDYFTKPENIFTAGTGLAAIIGSRDSEERNLQRKIREMKAINQAMKPTYEDIDDQIAKHYYAQTQKNKHRRGYLSSFPEIEPLYRKTNSDDDFKKTGKWFSYYNNPNFTGEPLAMKKGGGVENHGCVIEEEFSFPFSISKFLKGETGGQDDTVPILASDGEYVIDASTVSDLGDGNSKAGAKKLDEMVTEVRKHKRGGKTNLPPKSKSIFKYIK